MPRKHNELSTRSGGVEQLLSVRFAYLVSFFSPFGLLLLSLFKD